jgi:nucleoside-diphosphate-sugar epimerase
MKTILVTGGAGFVGSHACKALSRAGYLPVTFETRHDTLDDSAEGRSGCSRSRRIRPRAQESPRRLNGNTAQPTMVNTATMAEPATGEFRADLTRAPPTAWALTPGDLG